jgi:hypothetical protein
MLAIESPLFLTNMMAVGEKGGEVSMRLVQALFLQIEAVKGLKSVQNS